ncbi:MAG TPA: chemotaxis protein CheR, partial [Geobacteraceae bacterium]
GTSAYRLPHCRVVGTTVDPLELVAAAHGCFPHDPGREREFRAAVAPFEHLLGKLAMEFRQEDICRGAGDGEAYDVVLCNGLLGGPLLHEPAMLASAVAGLVARLRPGGVFLAADRFHAGWKRQVSTDDMVQLLKSLAVQPVVVGEGVGGIRT